ncbi:asparagine synthase (glutamine-hydrolyzing) [Mahella australiensis]|uniref:asparagine synthase (glutamine-hydrolyzing) n=1 Tax=Mahella australiensis (strain DSM 15567 / CIP 107919 / 50-1 BON) TaxID=697281 RepID=F4A1R1_MAHA5|nr:asparagine synthase (glutamine-hydrolyzing) [Mahella australiensis]AEE97111.1 asparagine synthase (glutamine-hydrolyzing) [Mahella australiensis 50-1 BON]
MCGIVGWIDWEANLVHQKRIIADMTAVLTHRGPDNEGMWLSPHAAFGHRRLIVVDPEGGGQPMIRRIDGSEYVIVYNGELYNTQDVRHELKYLGYSFQSRSDTEVLLMSYIAWGPDCLRHLNGIFAFAIWDDGKQSLFMARDRLGVKPLFYAQLKHGLIFGSETKAILAHPAIKPEVDAQGLAEVLAIGPARTPGHGVFRGIKELRPGYYMTYNHDGMKICQYWALDSHAHNDDLDTTADTVRWLLKDTVERQLVSDVPVCTLLSGGLDSSALTAFAAAAFKQNGLDSIDTYSVDYVNNDRYFKRSAFQPNSDSDWVPIISAFLGTRHHNIFIDTPELAEALTVAVHARDIPGMVDVDSSLYLFCREIKKGATVALSGECADEVFGGYPWFYREDALNADTFPWSVKVKERCSVFSPDVLKLIQSEKYIEYRYREALGEVPRLDSDDAQESRMREMFYLNLTRWMPVLLDRKDRMSMASGLEVRVPFCDHRIVEYVWNIPWDMKYYDQREKGILRYALTGILPEDILWRKKSPYPKTQNPSYLNTIRRWLSDILDDHSSPILPLIDVKMVRSILESDMDTFDLPWFGQLMTGPQLLAYLIQINIWLTDYHVSIL